MGGTGGGGVSRGGAKDGFRRTLSSTLTWRQRRRKEKQVRRDLIGYLVIPVVVVITVRSQ